MANELPSIKSAADCLMFLRDHLGWRLPEDAYVEELTFDWSGSDLRLPETAAQKLTGGTVRQLRALMRGQPWGIFLVEFASPQVYRTALRQVLRGDNQGQWEVEVHGFDYYNTKTGQIESGGSDRIALWMLDTDYDGRSLFPRQVLFPMAGEKEGWSKLAKNLRAEIDEEAIQAYYGTVSLPFKLGKHSRVSVKIVDDRGIESLKIIDVI